MSHSSFRIKLENRTYRRPFFRPMLAAWGKWDIREGVLLKITEESGRTGYGEIAPLESFGSKSLDEAVSFLKLVTDLSDHESLEAIIHKAPPACAFGLWSAQSNLMQDVIPATSAGTAALMTIGRDWRNRFYQIRENGLATVKVKVGINSPEEERGQLAELLNSLKENERIRIDPNRSWTREDLDCWLDVLRPQADKVEFIEEPITPGTLAPQDLIKLAEESPIPLALDEFLSNDGIEPWLEMNWPGFWILKPSILGIPNLISRLSKEKVVISSVFETGIGMNSLISLATDFPDVDHGLGTGDYFDDKLSPLPVSGRLYVTSKEQLQHIWNHFPIA